MARRGRKPKADFPAGLLRRRRRVPLAERLARLRRALPPLAERRCPVCGRGQVAVEVTLAAGRELIVGRCLACGREADLLRWLGPPAATAAIAS